MSDGLHAALWLALLGGGGLACVVLHRLGVARTHVRDLLHVGAGVWVLGLPRWENVIAPIVITLGAALLVPWLPALGARLPALGRFVAAVSDDEERWSGIVLYTLSFAALTAVACLTSARLPAAAGLLALSLGDGVGGAVGRRYGKHHFRAPGGKAKSVEGSLAVAVMAGVGVLLASLSTGVPVTTTALLGAALVASLAEAAAPRASDNLLVPLAVLAWLRLVP